MSKLVTIYGGSGFLGRQIAQAMARQGWRVRVAVRRPNEALSVRTYGAVGQVEPVACNVRDDFSVRAAMTDADAVINCVGVIVSEGRNRFDAVNEAAAGRIARLSVEMGVPRLVQVSALGADANAKSGYLSSKGRGEALVLEARPDAVILRPSVMFGAGDSFYNKLAGLVSFAPIVAITGGRSEVQPVFVDDVARVAVMAAGGEAPSGIYELGGPEVMTLRQVMAQILGVIGRRRLVVSLPGWLAAIPATGLDVFQWASGGLVTNRLITRDQLRALRVPNRVGTGTMGFADLGITPVAADAVIPDYLWRFRPSGQYAAIKASAKKLRAR
ncbi:complex I NDUFA9 subunit family protein [Paracoccus suum]|uniref:Complex I NDUFA9 subunit family protein n=1 Tax=Paracoccus suum TaxID=2259340 RepID=A0A344PIP1_9RHOB|nr:complex I NDUFA9 subunit family protein [Paracoccus suum]AXC49246.1 complex I NDUFA9 subunit family protein [Paracoccus suum]